MITLRDIFSLAPNTTAWDEGKGAVAGFGARRQRSAAVSYVLKYRLADGRQRWHTIGRHGAPWTPDIARNEALRLRIDGQIADAWFGVDALRKVVQIYVSRQLPPARSSVDNARNGFQAGSSDISMVFESERRLRAVQLDLLKLKVELQTKYAEMERLAGGSL